MNFLKWTLTFALFATMTGSLTAAPADLLKHAPEDAELIAYVEASTLMESDLFKEIMDQGGDEFLNEDKMDAIRVLTGVDVKSDIHEISLVGDIDQEETIALCVKGNFDQDRLTSLVRLSESYEKLQKDGYIIHHWSDDGEKYATFLNDTTIIFTQSSRRMGNAIESYEESDNGFLRSRLGAYIQSSFPDATAWAVIQKPEEHELGELFRALEVENAILRIDTPDNKSELTVFIQMNESEQTQHMKKMLEGLKSFALLQTEKEVWRKLAESSEISESSLENAVSVQMILDNEEILPLAIEATR